MPHTPRAGLRGVLAHAPKLKSLQTAFSTVRRNATPRPRWAIDLAHPAPVLSANRPPVDGSDQHAGGLAATTARVRTSFNPFHTNPACTAVRPTRCSSPSTAPTGDRSTTPLVWRPSFDERLDPSPKASQRTQRHRNAGALAGDDAPSRHWPPQTDPFHRERRPVALLVAVCIRQCWVGGVRRGSSARRRANRTVRQRIKSPPGTAAATWRKQKVAATTAI